MEEADFELRRTALLESFRTLIESFERTDPGLWRRLVNLKNETVALLNAGDRRTPSL